jgi:hypothetical protein
MRTILTVWDMQWRMVVVRVGDFEGRIHVHVDRMRLKLII